MAAGEALIVIGFQEVQIFYNENRGGFLLSPLE
jgi:hypothetical protein